MTDIIPDFDSDGLLPAGDYELPDSIRGSLIVTGMNWNFPRRFVNHAGTVAPEESSNSAT